VADDHLADALPVTVPLTLHPLNSPKCDARERNLTVRVTLQRPAVTVRVTLGHYALAEKEARAGSGEGGQQTAVARRRAAARAASEAVAIERRAARTFVRHGARYVATPRGDAAAASEAAAIERHGRLGAFAQGARLIRGSERNSARETGLRCRDSAGRCDAAAGLVTSR